MAVEEEGQEGPSHPFPLTEVKSHQHFQKYGSTVGEAHGGRKGHEADNSMPAQSLNRSTDVTLYPQADATVPGARGQGQLHRANLRWPCSPFFSSQRAWSLLEGQPLSKGHMPAVGGAGVPQGIPLIPQGLLSHRATAIYQHLLQLKWSSRCCTQNISNPDK